MIPPSSGAAILAGQVALVTGADIAALDLEPPEDTERGVRTGRVLVVDGGVVMG